MMYDSKQNKATEDESKFGRYESSPTPNNVKTVIIYSWRILENIQLPFTPFVYCYNIQTA